MPYDQGDIVLVNFPFTELTAGSKPRPAIVVSNIDINYTDDVILAAISSNLRNDDFSFILDNSFLTRPLEKPCEVRCHKLFTCDQDSIIKPITKLTDPHISNLAKAIKRCFSTR